MRCAVDTCPNTSLNNPEIKFFKFPRNPVISRRWVNNCGRKDLIQADIYYLHNCCGVCSVHFAPAMFTDVSQTSLHDHAQPTIINNSSDYGDHTYAKNRRAEDSEKIIPDQEYKNNEICQTLVSFTNNPGLAVELLTADDKLNFAGITAVDLIYIKSTVRFPRRYPEYLSPEDRILLTLGKYRHNVQFEMLSFLFKVSVGHAIDCFETVTDGIFYGMTPSKFAQETIESTNQVVLDLIEIPVEVTKNEMWYKLTFCEETSTTIFKALICVDDKGQFIFCSDLYGGCTSDCDVFILSDFINTIKPGVIILSNKPLDIKILFDERKITFIYAAIANFLTKKKLGLCSQFRILQESIPRALWHVANKVFRNCVMVYNFKIFVGNK